MVLLSRLRLAEASYFFGGGVTSVEFLRLALFCDNPLTGETLHSAEFLGLSLLLQSC